MKIPLIILLSFIQVWLFGQQDWELARDKKQTKVWVKDYPDSNFKQFKSETILEAKLQEVVAVQLDIANMGKWYDNVGEVELVEKVSDLEGVYIVNFDMPFPVRNRISAIRAKMTYDISTNTVHIITQYEPGILDKTDVIHVKNIQSKWAITDLGDGTVKILHSGHMDPSGSLPAWIGNTGVKDGPIKSFKGLRKILPDYAGTTIDWLN